MKPEARLGLGDGLREDGFDCMPNLVLLLITGPAAELLDIVRLCEGKLVMLLCIIGDGPCMPSISGVPSLLGLVGLRAATVDDGRSTKCASSGGAWTLGCSAVGCEGRRVAFGSSFFSTLGWRWTSVLEVGADDFGSRVEEPSSSLCREIRGLACNGLTCRARVVDFTVNVTPGEYEDMDVGVEETLNGPGDSE